MKTIIYYTSNREDANFERKIMDCLVRQANGIKIISVSQKPIDLGDNICVGELPFNEISLMKQILIGLKAAKTRFCYAAESDFIYPPEYFSFTPERDDQVYRYANVWVNWTDKGRVFYKKRYSEGCQVSGRTLWIDRLEKTLSLGIEAWNVFPEAVKNSWTSDNPAVSFKTKNGLHRKTNLKRKVLPRRTLPYWGDCCDFFNKN